MRNLSRLDLIRRVLFKLKARALVNIGVFVRGYMLIERRAGATEVGLNKIDILKINVKETEVSVLKRAKNTLRRVGTS